MDVFGWDYWLCDTSTGLRKRVGRNGGERHFSYEKAYLEGWHRTNLMLSYGEDFEECEDAPCCYSVETRLNLNGKIPDVRIFKEKVPVATDLDMVGLVLVYGLQKYLFTKYLKDLCNECRSNSTVSDSHNLHVLHRENACVYDYSLLCEVEFGSVLEIVFQQQILDTLFEENKHMFSATRIRLSALKSFLTDSFLTSPAFKYERFMLKEALKQTEVVPSLYRNNFVTRSMLDLLPGESH